jgi:hypothetical protein
LDEAILKDIFRQFDLNGYLKKKKERKLTSDDPNQSLILSQSIDPHL